MKTAHPGCGGHAGSKGYNSGGHYCGGWAGNCGDGGVGGSSWYLICEKCRAAHMARSRQPQQPQMDIDAKNRANLKQPQQQQPQLPGMFTCIVTGFLGLLIKMNTCEGVWRS